MRDIKVTVKGVQNLLAGLKTNKAIGPDLLPTRILKDHADVIAPVFAMLFQTSQCQRIGNVQTLLQFSKRG